MGLYKYHADQVDGNVLMHIDHDQGWVEKINESTQLCWCLGPRPKIWQNLRDAAMQNLQEHYQTFNGKLGVVQKLADERMSAPFVLPPMLSVTADAEVIYGTGMSRLTAELMCGTPTEQISMIVACDDVNRMRPYFEQVRKLTSTAEFEQAYNLDQVDYSIVWEPNEQVQIRFINSIVKHSVYESFQETDKYFTGANNLRLQYLDIFARNNPRKKIPITVYCVEEQQKFFTPTDSVFEVNFLNQPPSEWVFSYGRLMGAFRPSTQGAEPTLNVWAFDINQPVDLYLLLMWASAERSSYYTRNRKLTVFNPTNVTVIKEIPDLIK